MKFIQLLNENWGNARKLIKVNSPLFHGTKSIVQILRDGNIKASSVIGLNKFGGQQADISTTRNLDFLLKSRHSEFGGAIFVLDKDRIAKDFKIIPHQFGGGISGHQLNMADESEERIQTSKLPLKKYVKGLIVRTDSTHKKYIEDWASWKKEFNLPFDVIVYFKGKYKYAKDML